MLRDALGRGMRQRVADVDRRGNLEIGEAPAREIGERRSVDAVPWPGGARCSSATTTRGWNSRNSPESSAGVNAGSSAATLAPSAFAPNQQKSFSGQLPSSSATRSPCTTPSSASPGTVLLIPRALEFAIGLPDNKARGFVPRAVHGHEIPLPPRPEVSARQRPAGRKCPPRRSA